MLAILFLPTLLSQQKNVWSLSLYQNMTGIERNKYSMYITVNRHNTRVRIHLDLRVVGSNLLLPRGFNIFYREGQE